MSVIELERTDILPDPPPPAELDEVGKNILAAAEIIRERGKIEGTFGRPGGPRCAVGAGVEVLGADEHNVHTYYISREHARLSAYVYATSSFTSVTGWSDAHTQEEVVAGMKQAAWL